MNEINPNDELYLIYKTLGEKWMIDILHNLKKGDISYNEIKRSINGTINSTLLSTRLKKLVLLNIIKKKKNGNRVIYSLTQEGLNLMNILDDISDWAQNSKGQSYE